MRTYRSLVPDTPPSPEDLQKVFVYGTLRPRDGRPGWAGAAEVAPAVPATTPGRLYMGPGFPYFVKDVHETGLVLGDVLTMDIRHPTYHHMRRVELGAGYHEVTVVCTDVETGARITALAWNADVQVRPVYCSAARRIVSGDFLSPEADEIFIRMEKQFV